MNELNRTLVPNIANRNVKEMKNQWKFEFRLFKVATDALPDPEVVTIPWNPPIATSEPQDTVPDRRMYD